jgi:glycine/D-amino acid oxidase-like deaminating enzyme
MPLTTRRTTEFPVEHRQSQRVVTRSRDAEAAIFSGHPEDTEQSDLRSPRTPWAVPPPRPVHPPSASFRCEVLIVGAGITGALMAERLTRQGLEVVLIDRESPGQGSTAASTAMLLWEIDRTLSELTQLHGLEHAARCYRASFEAVNGLQRLVATHGLPCRMRRTQSLFLASADTAKSLQDEMALRHRVGLPGAFLDHAALLETFDIARAAAILSPAAADADPVQLTSGLLDLSLRRGARLFEANAVIFESGGSSVGVGLDNGLEIEARYAVLATGYVRPDTVRPKIQRVTSSWAIATAPQPQNLWKDGVLIWEDSKDYHYARTTADGRIILGGEDDSSIVEPDTRDAVVPAKAKQLAQNLAALWPRAALDIDYRWAGTFDSTHDGLPLIGAVPGANNLFAAYGYGGNGITFSYLAAELIGALIAGPTSPLLDDFAIDRSAP